MLQRIRDGLQGQKWLAWIILGLIGATFVFWGGSSSLDFTGVSSTTAAEVDGVEIPASEATRAWSETQARWSQQFGTDIPAEQRVAMQQRILDGLVLQQAHREAPAKTRTTASARPRCSIAVQTIPQFHGPDGKYDPGTARAVLAQASKSESEFLAETRSELLINQLQQGIGGSYFLTRAEQQRLFNLENEEREVQYALFAADKFAGSDPIDDAAIKAYYDKNGDRFMTTESVALEYAELRLEQLATQVAPTEADLQKLYDDNRAMYVLDERRRARHIVIAVNGDDDAARAQAGRKRGRRGAHPARTSPSSRRNIRAIRRRARAATWASCRKRISPVRSATRCSR